MYMQRSRLNPDDPNSVLVKTITTLLDKCVGKWGAWVIRTSGIYTPFYQKMIEVCNSVCYKDTRAGGTLHFDWDRTKTVTVRTKELTEEAYDIWFKLSEDKRRGLSDIEELVVELHAVPDNNPPGTEAPALRDNPETRHHPLHFGSGRNPGAVENAQLVSMLGRVQHSMR
jgi:hypothetical protein